MYYHFSIILIFYPLKGIRFLDSKISPLEVCTDAANAIVTLARSYERLHGLHRTPCLLPYIVFASGIAHLGAVDLQSNLVDAVTQSAQEIAILQLMSLHHGSSKSAVRILLSRAVRPSSATGDQDNKGAVEDAYPLWEPFGTTMTWPSGSAMQRDIDVSYKAIHGHPSIFVHHRSRATVEAGLK
jgi:hypothetical protein